MYVRGEGEGGYHHYHCSYSTHIYSFIHQDGPSDIYYQVSNSAHIVTFNLWIVRHCDIFSKA